MCLLTGLIGYLPLHSHRGAHCSGFPWKTLPFGLAPASSVHYGPVASGHSSASAGSRDVSILGPRISRSGISASGLSDTRCQLTTALLTRVFVKPDEVCSCAHPGMLHVGAMIVTCRGWTYPPLVRGYVLYKHRLGSCLRLLCRLEPSCEYQDSWLLAIVPLCLFRLRPVSIHLAEHYDSRRSAHDADPSQRSCASGYSGMGDPVRLVPGAPLLCPLLTITLTTHASPDG